jgi:hypothetical protein
LANPQNPCSVGIFVDVLHLREEDFRLQGQGGKGRISAGAGCQ